MSSSSSVLVDQRGPVVTITLNRPEKLNSFDRTMALRLQEVLKHCMAPEVRTVVLSGSGRAFCAGQDLGACLDPENPRAVAPGLDLGTIVREQYNPIIKLIRQLPKPVVCAVKGVAAGAGANIAFACDLVIASVDANFIQSFSKIGLSPDSGGSVLLPRLLGLGRATALFFFAERVSAEDAFRLGLVYKVVPTESLENEQTRIAETLAAGPTRSFALTKEAVNASLFSQLDELLEREASLQARAGQSGDFREGVSAFLEKRQAVFRGE